MNRRALMIRMVSLALALARPMTRWGSGVSRAFGRWVLPALCVGLAGCAQGPRAAVKTYSSGNVLAYNQTGWIWMSWYDDDTLVFVGDTDREPSPTEPPNGHIYVWRMGRTPELYAPKLWPPPGEDARHYEYVPCAGHGVITYATGPARMKDGYRLLPARRGPLGHETPYTLALPEAPRLFQMMASNDQLYRRCDAVFDSTLNQNAWNVSPDGRYHLDLGTFQPDASSPEGDWLRFETLTEIDQTTKRSWIYNVPPADNSSSSGLPWSDTFLVWARGYLDYPASRMLHGRMPVWLLPTSGKAERMILTTDAVPAPSGFVKSFREVIPTPAGLYVIVDILNAVGYNLGGLFKEKDGHYSLIAQGWFFMGSLSPSGCRLALTRPVHPNATFDGSTTVFELCSKRG